MAEDKSKEDVLLESLVGKKVDDALLKAIKVLYKNTKVMNLTEDLKDHDLKRLVLQVDDNKIIKRFFFG